MSKIEKIIFRREMKCKSGQYKIPKKCSFEIYVLVHRGKQRKNAALDGTY